ncbi:hypothetical protein UACE39S_00166 [Ureibacillus acetophenoni]
MVMKFSILLLDQKDIAHVRKSGLNFVFPVNDEHFFCGMQDHEKISIIKDLNLDYYFDDKPAVLETLKDIPTKIFVKDQSYNQHIEIPRVKEWTNFRIRIRKSELICSLSYCLRVLWK